MNALLKSKNMPFLALILGGVGAVLRWLLYALTTDGKNLIPVGHPLGIGLWIVTAAAAILILAAVLPLRNAENHPDRFRRDVPAALGSLAAAAGIGLTVLLGRGEAAGALGILWKITGVMAFASLDVIAGCRWQGRQPFFVLHALVCVFFAIHMVSCYRGWSSNPQLMDYVFTLFSCIGLMLFAFHHSCLEVGMGKLRVLPAVGLLSVYCCTVALSGSDAPWLCLGGALWTATNLCRLHTGE